MLVNFVFELEEVIVQTDILIIGAGLRDFSPF